MVKEKMYRQIQVLRRQGFSRTEIAQELMVDPKTTAKYFRMSEEEFWHYQQEHRFRDKLLEEFEKDILAVYESNEFKKLNMSAVYDFLEERHGALPCNEKTLRNFIRYLIEVGKLKLNESLRSYTKVPELPLGKQMQLDFGQYTCRSGLKLYIFVAVLSASRYKYVAFQDHPFKTLDVIHHLLDCFDFFGGIPEEMVIDQDRLMVVSENSGDIVFTRDFGVFIEEIGIKMYVCRRADPETKGKVENGVKYVKKNFLDVRDFNVVDEANEDVLKWLRRRANGKISQATQQIPAIMIEKEREKLKPIINSVFRKTTLIGREARNVNNKGRISINASLYQLPARYRNKTVDVYIADQDVFVYDSYNGEEIVSYGLSFVPGELKTRREYKRGNDLALKELKSQVRDMFEAEKWALFVDGNFKAFSRYVRDQCVEAKKHFEDKEIEIPVLSQALQYCLENNTPSFSNLNDTYHHFLKEVKMHETEFTDHSNTAINSGYQGEHKTLPVASREVGTYATLISNRGN